MSAAGAAGQGALVADAQGPPQQPAAAPAQPPGAGPPPGAPQAPGGAAAAAPGDPQPPNGGAAGAGVDLTYQPTGVALTLEEVRPHDRLAPCLSVTVRPQHAAPRRTRNRPHASCCCSIFAWHDMACEAGPVALGQAKDAVAWAQR